MASIKFEFDHLAASAAQKDLVARQIPFAQSVALNQTAFQARAAVIAQLPQKFDIKGSYLRRSIRVDKSNKKQTIIEAKVYEQTAFSMALQQFGGEKRAKGGGSVVIPTATLRKEGTLSSGKRKKQYYAKNLVKQYKGPRAAGRLGGAGKYGKGKAKAFPITVGNRTLIVRRARGAKRTSKAKHKYSNEDFQVLYGSHRSARVDAQWDFDKTVQGVAKNTLPRNYAKALARAIKTAK